MADNWEWKGHIAENDMHTSIVHQLNRLERQLKPVIESYTPVLTGKMKAGWELYLQESSQEIIITNRMPYWIFVEMGTSRMAARAPLRKALASYSKSAASVSLAGRFSARTARKRVR